MIKLDDNYMVDVDSYNYTLIRDKHKLNDKTGKPITVAVGYFGDLQGCLKRYAELTAISKLKDCDVTLPEAIKIITESNDKLIVMLNQKLPNISNQIDAMLEDN